MIDLFGKSDSIEQLGEAKSNLIYVGKYDQSNIKISIVIPTYKRSELLMETFNSCESIYNNQEYEILIVFNKKGESGEIINCIKSRKVENVRVYENKENIGMFQNWNQGSILACGEWISIIHDDDMFEPAYLEILPKLIKKVSPKVAYINFNGNIITYERYCDVLKKGISKLAFKKAKLRDVRVLGVSPFFAATCGTLIRRKTLVELGGFDASTYPSGDVFLPIKFMNNGYYCYICSKKINYYRKQINASSKKEVMDAFIKYYGELQTATYADNKTNFFYRIFKDCLYFKSIWHVFLQADSNNVILDSERPDPIIQTTIKYKVMDVFQRIYLKLKINTLFVYARR